MALQVNIDIQQVLIKTVTYMCVYFSKSEDETSECINQAANEARESNSSSHQQMKSIARAYSARAYSTRKYAIVVVTIR